ncbi:hypothetical protein L2E82_01314 [Cichorium intybus]|uniref:Uncharacterized protein n=1 Tax=Cichorium intybus TaxID=13427 RepID=A0ACB9GZM4_CICIN|nr:hypothetical protein L2E82_01314 [Cichorium intybus]
MVGSLDWSGTHASSMETLSMPLWLAKKIDSENDGRYLGANVGRFSRRKKYEENDGKETKRGSMVQAVVSNENLGCGIKVVSKGTSRSFKDVLSEKSGSEIKDEGKRRVNITNPDTLNIESHEWLKSCLIEVLGNWTFFTAHMLVKTTLRLRAKLFPPEKTSPVQTLLCALHSSSSLNGNHKPF